jgi:hypothetical protein
MKKIILTVIAAAISYCIAYTQPCLPEGIEFYSQEQIDNFQTNYPGCTEIGGDVIISGTEITNLNGLNVLISIAGNIDIGYNGMTPLLITLSGFDNLTSIGGYLKIYGNNNLIYLTGLENLTTIGGSLIIGQNLALTSLAGLENLTTVGGNLEIDSNSSLTSLVGLENLTTIGADLIIGSLPLTGLSGLENLSSIGGNLWIAFNSFLSTCDAEWLCNYLSNPTGSINIYNNSPGCNNPAEIASYCGFAMPCLPFGNYYFINQAEIDNFQNDYPGCTELDGSVTIRDFDYDSITNLTWTSQNQTRKTCNFTEWNY